MDVETLTTRVRELYAEGRSTNQIARELGVPRGKVAPLVRALARAQARSALREPELVGCWVSPGWSTGLTFKTRHDWPERAGSDPGGIAAVLVAREHRRDPSAVTVCAYLVDTYCLGVKSAVGPGVLGRDELHGVRADFFAEFDEVPLEVPLELARELVWGAVEYARGLGFEPPRDFRPAAGHLGPWEGPSQIGFGYRGEPWYTQGPYDDVERILATLDHNAKQSYTISIAVPEDALPPGILAAS